MTDVAKKVLGVLDPPCRKLKDGTLVSSEAYYNLEGAILDLQRKGADAVCIRTLKRVQKQISDVMKICETELTR